MQTSLVSPQESLERALRHVSQGWLPPQAEVLDKVRARLEKGEYENNRKALTDDLKEDFALFTYCLKELSTLLNSNSLSPRINVVSHQDSGGTRLSPMEVLELCSLDDFKKILETPAHQISPHNSASMNEFQTLRLRETALSATTA